MFIVRDTCPRDTCSPLKERCSPFKETQTTSLLDSAEILKCKLSDSELKETKVIKEIFQEKPNTSKFLSLSKAQFETLLID